MRIDTDDLQMLGRLVIYSLLVLWAALIVAVALGLGVRAYQFAAFGGL